MLKKSKILIALCLILACVLSVVSCNLPGAASSDKPVAEANNNNASANQTIAAVYSKAVSLGYEGNLDEFLALVNGKNGTDGKDGANGKDGADGKDGNNGADGINGADGVYIVDVTVFEDHLVVYLSDKSSIDLGPIKNLDGENGKDGADGKDGDDGLIPYIGPDGYWWIGKDSTGIFAEGPKGETGENGNIPYVGTNGNWWIDTIDTGIGAMPSVKNGYWWIGDTDTGVKAVGEDGKIPYVGANGNWWIDGKDTDKGALPKIGNNGNWYVGDFDTGIQANGKDGADGKDGEDGKDGVDGEDGTDGLTPTIGENGNWWIGETDTGVKVEGKDGVVIEKVEVDAEDNLIITLTDGTVINLGKVEASEDACSHEYSDWTTDEEPSCTSLGLNSRTCSKCGDVDYDFIPAIGHIWGNDVYVIANPTQYANGKISVTCTVCSVLKIDNFAYNDDNDSDGITNGDEVNLFNTNPFAADTDGDELSDYDEIYTYFTDARKIDTDGDGASDGREIYMGFDPCVFNDSFVVVKVPVIDDGETENTVVPSIQVELNGNQVDSLVVKRDEFFEESTLGYVGDAYDYSVEGDITSAVIGFQFDANALPANALPTIYSYDRINGVMTPLSTNVSGGVATAEVTELSTFVLLDRRVYENELKWVDVWGLGDSVYSNIEIVFVIDDSGSMGPVGVNNDPYNQRLSVSRELIEKLPAGSKIGVVRFDDTVSVLTDGLIDDKAKASSYLTTTYFDSKGGTYMYSGIMSALELYSENNGQTMQIMIVLSDGSANDSSKHESTINAAIAKGVSIYSVALGASNPSYNNTTYFNQYLKPLAERTSGQFYYSSNASALADIYANIGEKIDLVTDSDNDGLCDYYEDNMVVFDGLTFKPDKDNPDTDGDGLKDGEEIKTVTVLSVDGKKMTIMGKVYSNPTLVDSDGDGVDDMTDKYPMNPNKK